MTNEKLSERVENAGEGSFALDCEIADALWMHSWGKKRPRDIRAASVTSSMDDAIEIIPTFWRLYSADMSVKGQTRFLIEGPKTQWGTDETGEKCAGDDWYSQGIAATPALALCAAALRARGL